MIMAELPDVGGRCEFKSCSRLDECLFYVIQFLSTRCKPALLELHVASSDHRFTHGCENSKQVDREADVNSSNLIRVFMCSMNGCTETEIIRIACPHCEKNYCLKHRYADKHSCDVLCTASKPCQVSTSATMSSSTIQKPTDQPKPKPLNEVERKKMDRILVMKLKMNAKMTADIPTEERIFLFVEGDDVQGRQAVVVSQKWTIGRCASTIKRLLFPDESKNLQIFKEHSVGPLDYAESVSTYLHDMDTVKVRLI